MRLFLFINLLFFNCPLKAQKEIISPDNTFNNVTGYLFRYSDNNHVKLDKNLLFVDTIQLAAVKDLDSELIYRAVLPNEGAYNLIYQLNPSIASLNELKTGNLILPAYRKASQLSKAEISTTYLADIELNRASKEKIFKAIQFSGPPQFTHTTDTLGVSLFFNAIDSSLKIITGSIKDDNKSTLLDSLTLSQIKDEVELYKVIRKSSRFSAIQITQLQNLKESIGAKALVLSGTRAEPGVYPETFPQGNFMIHIKDTSNKEVQGFRVYYVAKAFGSNSEKFRSFSTLSSPTEQRLPEATYIIWAAKPEDYTPVSDKLMVQIRKNTNPSKPTDIELQLKK